MTKHNTAFRLLILALLAVALSAPCAWGSQHSSDKTSGKEVSKELDDAYDAIKNYTIDKKDQFVAWSNKRMEKLDKKIADLKQDIDEAGDEAKKNWKETLAALKKERQQLGKKLEAVKASSSEAWADVKWGFSAAYEKLEQAYENAADKFEDEGEDGEESSDK